MERVGKKIAMHGRHVVLGRLVEMMDEELGSPAVNGAREGKRNVVRGGLERSLGFDVSRARACAPVDGYIDAPTLRLRLVFQNEEGLVQGRDWLADGGCGRDGHGEELLLRESRVAEAKGHVGHGRPDAGHFGGYQSWYISYAGQNVLCVGKWEPVHALETDAVGGIWQQSTGTAQRHGDGLLSIILRANDVLRPALELLGRNWGTRRFQQSVDLVSHGRRSGGGIETGGDEDAVQLEVGRALSVRAGRRAGAVVSIRCRSTGRWCR